jgi:hypothetical protein
VSHDVDVSVIIPFSDDEERVGRLARRLGRHLASLHVSAEIIAADEGSSDNSVALLGWLAKHELPMLRVCGADPGRGFATGTALARGRVLWLIDVHHVDLPLSPFAWAHARIVDDQADVVIVSGRFVLARRVRAWKAVEGLRGRSDRFEDRLRRRAKRYGLRVEGAMGDFREHLVRGGAKPASEARGALWDRVRGLYLPRKPSA